MSSCNRQPSTRGHHVELLQRPAGETSEASSPSQGTCLGHADVPHRVPCKQIPQRVTGFDALLFSVSVAVGITDVAYCVTTCLSRWNANVKKDAIVKNPAVIQNLGAMDICADKMTCITADGERHLNILE